MKSSANHTWPWTGAADPEVVFRQTYPAPFAHFDQYRQQLNARQDQGEHWRELRSCAYWDKFEKPKVMYQDITWNQRFCLDTIGRLSNNTVYFLPTAAMWATPVLNAPISWWSAWRSAQDGKDEALRFFTDYLNAFPIPKPTDAARARVEALVKELIDLKGRRTAGLRAMTDWLQTEIGIEKVNNKLRDLIGLTVEELLAEIKKLLPKKEGLNATDLQRINSNAKCRTS